GGFPETSMEMLEANVGMRQAMAGYIERGYPVYAECGGLMYLCRNIIWGSRVCAMVGVIDADAVMYARPQGRGYVRLQDTVEHLWPGGGVAEVAAHEFHYARLEGLGSGLRFAWRVIRGSGIDGVGDGIIYKNLIAGFTHLRDVSAHHWTLRFLEHVRNCKSKLNLS
ncbi:hydrogenase expression protein HypE, partial [Achromatium sp. WMS2]